MGALVVGSAFYLLSTMGVSTDRLTSGLYMVILGLGIGLTMQVMVVIAQNAAAIPDVGTATSTVTLGRLVGGSLGVSIFGSIFTSRLTDQLAQHLPAGAASRLPSTDSITPALISRLPAALRQGFELAFSNALTGMFVYAIPIIALAFVLVLTLREVPLRGSEDKERTTADAGRAGRNGTRCRRTGGEPLAGTPLWASGAMPNGRKLIAPVVGWSACARLTCAVISRPRPPQRFGEIDRTLSLRVFAADAGIVYFDTDSPEGSTSRIEFLLL